MKYYRRKFRFYIFNGLIWTLLGGAAIVAVVLKPEFLTNLFENGEGGQDWYTIALAVGIVLAFIGILFLLAAMAQVYKSNVKAAKKKAEEKAAKAAAAKHAKPGTKAPSKAPSKAPAKAPAPKPKPPAPKPPEPKPKPPAPVPIPVPQPVPEPAPIPEPEPTPITEEYIQYFPSENAYDLVNLGPKQSIEEKFIEISKMDRTQFVVYVARLFTLKGYTVKYTPVIDNYNIDLIVEKMGVSIAVGCILTNKVLGEVDVRPVASGRMHYQANNVMVLTNMYFDRTALNFAKEEKMSLVDRNLLAEDFM